MAGWWQALAQRRQAAALTRRAIPDALWTATLSQLPFLTPWPAETLARLRTMASLFLDRKEYTGAGGFVVDDGVALSIAVQACLPILELGIEQYDGFVGIVVHADSVVAQRTSTDDDGIVHHYEEVLAGEAMEGGPVMLSWADAVGDPGESAMQPAFNVVVHEFAHVLDLRDGAADGVPLLAGRHERAAWLAELMPAYDWFCERTVCGHASSVDAYGATSPDEFFAVASEAFFVKPEALKEEQPALYRLLATYYRQDPAGY